MSFSSPSSKRTCAALVGGARGRLGQGEGRLFHWPRWPAVCVWLCMTVSLPAMAALGDADDALRLHPRLTPSFVFTDITSPASVAASLPVSGVTLRPSVCSKVTPLYPMSMAAGAVRCHTMAHMPRATNLTSTPRLTARVSKSLVMPVTYSRVSSDYGTRYHPVRRVRHTHTGIDLVAPHGAPVRVVAEGVVKTIGYERRGFGRYVVIEHRYDSETIYAHLSATARGLRVGDTVAAGELIGAVGKTGMVTGAHLHFELRRRGVPADPRPLLRRTTNAGEAQALTGSGCAGALDGPTSCTSPGRTGGTDRWHYSPL